MSRIRHSGGVTTYTTHAHVHITEYDSPNERSMHIHAVCREGEAWQITPRQLLWAGIDRGGQASQSRSHMHAFHARSRMQNAARTYSASSRREEVGAEERQVDVDLTS